MQENQISQECFELSASNRTGHDVLFQSSYSQSDGTELLVIKFFEELCNENGQSYPHRLLCSIVYTISEKDIR